MPKPTTGICTDAYYLIMKECWRKVPEGRPTFEALNNWFYDYFIKNEPQYQQNQFKLSLMCLYHARNMKFQYQF